MSLCGNDQPNGVGWGMPRAPTAWLNHLSKGFQIILIKIQFCLTWRQNNKTFFFFITDAGQK
jgi:hypothetical protein